MLFFTPIVPKIMKYTHKLNKIRKNKKYPKRKLKSDKTKNLHKFIEYVMRSYNIYFCYGITNKSVALCFTILHLYALSSETQPRQEITICLYVLKLHLNFGL